MTRRKGYMTFVALVIIQSVHCYSTVNGTNISTASSLNANATNFTSLPLYLMAPCRGFVLEEATIDDIQGALKQGIFTSVQLTQCYLDRAAQLDDTVK